VNQIEKMQEDQEVVTEAPLGYVGSNDDTDETEEWKTSQQTSPDFSKDSTFLIKILLKQLEEKEEGLFICVFVCRVLFVC